MPPDDLTLSHGQAPLLDAALTDLGGTASDPFSASVLAPVMTCHMDVGAPPMHVPVLLQSEFGQPTDCHSLAKSDVGLAEHMAPCNLGKEKVDHAIIQDTCGAAVGRREDRMLTQEMWMPLFMRTPCCRGD